jgi:hypothetical protein
MVALPLLFCRAMRAPTLATAESGHPLVVTAVSAHSVMFTVGGREYRASLEARHGCAGRPPLAPGDQLTILRRAPEGDVLAAAACGCPHLVYNIALAHGLWSDV